MDGMNKMFFFNLSMIICLDVNYTKYNASQYYTSLHTLVYRNIMKQYFRFEGISRISELLKIKSKDFYVERITAILPSNEVSSVIPPANPGANSKLWPSLETNGRQQKNRRHSQ